MAQKNNDSASLLNESPRTLGIEFHQYCMDRECPNCPFQRYKMHSCAIAWYQARLGRDIETFGSLNDDSPVDFSQLSFRAQVALQAICDKAPNTITHRDLARISKSSLKNMRNCGSKTITEIVNYYHANNIPFKGEINF